MSATGAGTPTKCDQFTFAIRFIVDTPIFSSSGITEGGRFINKWMNNEPFLSY